MRRLHEKLSELMEEEHRNRVLVEQAMYESRRAEEENLDRIYGHVRHDESGWGSQEVRVYEVDYGDVASRRLPRIYVSPHPTDDDFVALEIHGTILGSKTVTVSARDLTEAVNHCSIPPFLRCLMPWRWRRPTWVRPLPPPSLP